LAYLQKVFAGRNDISVAGIAGPGDPFANPDETMETLRLVRKCYPDLLLCVATNGLNLLPYIEELSSLRVSHVSITINAVDPAIGENIYAWARDGITIYRGKEAAEVLLRRQMEAIAELKKHGIIVKVNSIIIPGVNTGHISEIAKEIAAAGADIMNPIPLYPVRGSVFENHSRPSEHMVGMCREKASECISIMTHCTRCRADAVGLLGEKFDSQDSSLLQSCASMPVIPGDDRPYIACASREGVLINMHLGQAEKFYVFAAEGKKYTLKAVRKAPEPGCGEKRWQALAEVLKDCRAVLVEAAGQAPREILNSRGIKVVALPGLITLALDAFFIGNYSDTQECCEKEHKGAKVKRHAGCECTGAGQGCG